MSKNNQRYEIAPEDFDVVCEVCGTKWDYIDDKAACPKCGDKLNKVEIATLKEEAYIRRRKKELLEIEKKKKKLTRNKTIRSFIIITIVLILSGYVFYRYCPEQTNTVISFLKNVFNN